MKIDNINCIIINNIRGEGEGNIEGYLHNSIILIDGDEIGVGINIGNLTIRENNLVGLRCDRSCIYGKSKRAGRMVRPAS